MSPILSELGKYFRLKDQEKSKSIKGKNIGDTLGSAKEIKVKFNERREISKPGGTNCTECLNSTPTDGILKDGDVMSITPLGGEGERTIRCTWNKQKSGITLKKHIQ